MESMVRRGNIDEDAREAIVSSLQWLKTDSIGQTGRRLSERLLGAREYLGMPASRFFAYCYDLRSQILHSGKPANGEIDLLVVSNACNAFVADLLLESFGVTA